MDELSKNEFGVEYDHVAITHVRMHRTDGKWLVEYRRKPRWFFDFFWWFNDGMYVNYSDAVARLEQLQAIKYVSIPRFQTTKTFKVEH